VKAVDPRYLLRLFDAHALVVARLLQCFTETDMAVSLAPPSLTGSPQIRPRRAATRLVEADAASLPHPLGGCRTYFLANPPYRPLRRALAAAGPAPRTSARRRDRTTGLAR
jgi:hypothetical protein